MNDSVCVIYNFVYIDVGIAATASVPWYRGSNCLCTMVQYSVFYQMQAEAVAAMPTSVCLCLNDLRWLLALFAYFDVL